MQRTLLLTTALISMLMFATATQYRRYPVCDPPCRNGGHVPTCCQSHIFDDGICRGGDAYCFNQDDQMEKNNATDGEGFQCQSSSNQFEPSDFTVFPSAMMDSFGMSQ